MSFLKSVRQNPKPMRLVCPRGGGGDLSFLGGPQQLSGLLGLGFRV